MKCPDKEQLMLYVDGELDATQSSEIKSHIAVCKDCQSEVEGFHLDVETEALLREKISSGFKKRSVSKKIMAAVMAEPKPVQNKKSSSAYPLAWFLKFLVPALAIAIALFIFFLGSSSQAPVKYTGKAYRVSVMANNKESFVDGQLYVANDSFKISEESLKKLDGSFIVNVVTTNKIYSINVDGKTDLTFDTVTMMPVFKDCNANISILDGDEARLNINGDVVRLTSKNPYNKKVKEEKVKVPEEEKKIAPEKSDLVTTLSAKVEEKPIESVKESKEEENINVESSDISINNEETLTQEATSGINIIDTDYEDEGNVVSPFSDR